MAENSTGTTVSKRGRKPGTSNKTNLVSVPKPAVEAEIESAPEISDLPPPPPQLTTNELYELKLAEAEFRAAQNLAEAARLKKLYVLAILDPNNRVAAADKERDTALISVSEAKRKYEHIKTSAFARLGLKASNIAGFDPETGVIHFPDSARG